VGALVALALLLRAAPGALLRLSGERLAAGGAYSSPRRLPFLLWVVHQAARRAAPARAAPVRDPDGCGDRRVSAREAT